ncbi:hypothetical protein F8O01_00380 [Pseudoclavibacter chungangensis]|uniref:Uncharacterized protein n=1 Tax=Pseudoclavibacter chungangensis TaxID=587635 RepID=A0A7J5C2M4_9MICO|nr:hypothetical protein [Pseudoclavibacter chungangensis]KAB1662442.1 hypothetical protein F8O01_00380 [Pseudoclavibacter chungangensis]NYJ68473.1 hypothetical protein [Pseudoclavibacter chungangensis]
MAPITQAVPTARGDVGTRPLRARRVPRRVAVLALTGGVLAGAVLGTGWHFLTLTPPVPASDIVQECTVAPLDPEQGDGGDEPCGQQARAR